MVRRPFHYQKKDYWCGPAVLKTVLAAHGQRLSQTRLARLLQTTKRSGTKRAMMAKVVRQFGLRATVRRDSTLGSLKRLLSMHQLTVVNYVEPESEGHYALVFGVYAKEIVLSDPWHGRLFRLDRKRFLAGWHGRQRWLMIVAK